MKIVFTAAAHWAEVVIMSKSCVFESARHFYQKPIHTARTTRVVATMTRRVRIVIRRVRMIKMMVPITRMVTIPRTVTILSLDSLNYFEFC